MRLVLQSGTASVGVRWVWHESAEGPEALRVVRESVWTASCTAGIAPIGHEGSVESQGGVEQKAYAQRDIEQGSAESQTGHLVPVERVVVDDAEPPALPALGLVVPFSKRVTDLHRPRAQAATHALVIGLTRERHVASL